jgi:uncharacterized membrane protein YesL
MRISHDTYNRVFDTVYLGMLGNVLVAIAALPFVGVLFATQPTRSWPLLVLLAPSLGPALVALFSMFTHHAEGSPGGNIRAFVRAWRTSFRRAVPAAAVATAAIAVLSVDAAAAGRSHRMAIVVPLLLMLDVLVVAVALVVLVGLAERPSARIRDLARPAIYLVVRRWYLSALSLVAVAVLMGVVTTRPTIGLGFLAAPMLYIVWANARFTLQPVLAGDAMRHRA